MSNETIVNRTPETFGQKIERERLEAETQVAKEEQIETLIAQVAATVSNTPSAASPNWIGPGAEPVLTPELETAVKEILISRSHAPRDPDLREFKDQVIAAFKHLGLDTRKFFGV